MKSKYKSTKIHNKQSGNSPKSCTYYDELDEIFGNSPAIISDATCSNLQGIVLEKKRKANTTSDNDVDTAAASMSYGTGKSHLQLKKIETEDTKVEHVVAQNSNGQSKVTVSVSKKLKTEERAMNAIGNLSKELQVKEDERMKTIKETHDEQLTATNRFIDVFETFMKGSKESKSTEKNE